MDARSEGDDVHRRPRGRARSARAILDSAYNLVLRDGLKATTIEAIAKDSGVSKVTIYRWWPSRAAVVMDAFLEKGTAALPYPDPVDPETIQIELLRMAQEFQGPTGKMICALISEGQNDPEIKQAFAEGYIGARRVQGAKLIQAAIDVGRIRSMDPENILDLLYAPLYFRLVVGHGVLDEAFVRAHVDLVWRGIAR